MQKIILPFFQFFSFLVNPFTINTYLLIPDLFHYFSLFSQFAPIVESFFLSLPYHDQYKFSFPPIHFLLMICYFLFQFSTLAIYIFFLSPILLTYSHSHFTFNSFVQKFLTTCFAFCIASSPFITSPLITILFFFWFFVPYIFNIDFHFNSNFLFYQSFHLEGFFCSNISILFSNFFIFSVSSSLFLFSIFFLFFLFLS